MCGIVGTLNLNKKHMISEHEIRQMLGMIRHRGPDQFGMYLDDQVGMGSARLSIIDLGTGQQPIANEDETLWIVFNGEIFNYVELRPGLEARGHRFTTTTDTEVILHLYEELGPACLGQLNGQFAFAIWDTRDQSLFIARDRLGIRPVFYTVRDGLLIFGSEVKALLAHPLVQAELDPLALDEIFTYWSTLSPRTIFEGLQDLPPGHYMKVHGGEIIEKRYWEVHFSADPHMTGSNRQGQPAAQGSTSTADQLEVFRDLLIDATKIRLRADVPVGAYLSGGLDSSTIAAIIRKYTGNRLDTFSISFSDAAFDESKYQQQMASYLGTDHQVVHATHEEIGRAFPEVIWHTETPILRTSPAPLFLLSELVRKNNYKVVLTGEGADEFLAGYNIFKEAAIRRFWARQPESAIRPLLLKRLYPYIADLASGSGAYLAAFFRQGLTNTENPYYSHAIRWANTSRAKRFFSAGLQERILARREGTPKVPVPADFSRWAPLHRAQYLEISVFLSQYLLSSQGDRMAMAHSVEGRFPFLDYRVVEMCNQLPPHLKLSGLTEKVLLKKLARELVPEEIWRRPKRPYRAPIHRSFFNDARLDYVDELLGPESIQASGLFNPAAVRQLVEKVQHGKALSETDDMALVGILSTQLVHQQFVADFRLRPPLEDREDIKIVRRYETVPG